MLFKASNSTLLISALANNAWNYAEIDIDATATSVVLVVMKGGASDFDPEADVAIDDVLLTDATCQGKQQALPITEKNNLTKLGNV